MRYLLSLALLIGCWVGCPLDVFAQNETAPYASLSGWEQASTEHFDVLYLPGTQERALLAARLAEREYVQIANLYNYTPEGRFRLFYLDDAPLLPLAPRDESPSTGKSGSYNLPQPTGFVAHPGTTHGLAQNVRTQVARLLLENLTHERRLTGGIQTELLNDQVAWYADGLSQYLGEGWSYAEETSLNALTEDLLDQALEGSDYLSRVVRKSIWHYVAKEYGDGKLGDIVYLVGISRSVESGVISVLGLTLNTLTNRWLEDLRNRIRLNQQGRQPLSEIEGLMRVNLPAESRVVGLAQTARGDRIALMLSKAGKHRLYLYDTASKNLRSTSVTSSFENYVGAAENVDYPLAWSPDGTRLFLTRYRGRRYELLILNVAENTLEVQASPVEFGRVLSAGWSHDGQRLALSALAKSTAHIFVTTNELAQFRRLTFGRFDHVDPSWSLDDNFLFFASNRDTAAATDARFSYGGILRPFDIYKLVLGGQEAEWVPITQTPFIDERFPQAISSFEVAYQTDASGIPNLSRSNIFLGESSSLTDIWPGMLRPKITEQRVTWHSYLNGKNTVLTAPLDAFSATVPEPTVFRRVRLLAATERARQKAELAQTLADTVPVAPLVPAVPDEEKVEVTAETAPPDTAGNDADEAAPVRYYIFDEWEEPYDLREEEEKVLNNPPPRSSTQQMIADEPQVPSLDDIEVDLGAASDPGWQLNRIRFDLGRRPDAGYYFGLGAEITDALRRHRISAYARPFLDFRNFRGRSGEASLRYAYLPMKIDVYADLNLLTRHYAQQNVLTRRDTAIYRYQTHSFALGARYPLSNFSDLRAEVRGMWLDRADQMLINQDAEPLRDQRERMARLELGYHLDRTRQREGFIQSGLRLDASVGAYETLWDRARSFQQAQIDLRYYRPVYRQITLAVRGNAAIRTGSEAPPFYLGGQEDWLLPVFFGQDDSRINRENALSSDLLDFGLQQQVMPVRGFWFFSRNGNKAVSLNAELRIPISRLALQGLNNRGLYRLEFIPFFDAAAVWTEGNPFSSRNPTDARTVGNSPVVVTLRTLKSPFLMTAGLGMRANLLGYTFRTDLAWGIEDGFLNQPILALSIGRYF